MNPNDYIDTETFRAIDDMLKTLAFIVIALSLLIGWICIKIPQWAEDAARRYCENNNAKNIS